MKPATRSSTASMYGQEGDGSEESRQQDHQDADAVHAHGSQFDSLPG
jgi:hypothetical protein